MATLQPLHGDLNSPWERFSPQQRQEMLSDDLAAGRSIALILGTIITMAALAGAIIVLLTA